MTLEELFDKLEDDNDHGLCAMLCAVACRDYKAVIRLGEIIKTHLAQGSMPYDLIKERCEIMTPLYKQMVEEGKVAQ